MCESIDSSKRNGPENRTMDRPEATTVVIEAMMNEILIQMDQDGDVAGTGDELIAMRECDLRLGVLGCILLTTQKAYYLR